VRGKRIVRGLLISFVLISVGFFLGKETTLRTVRNASVNPGAEVSQETSADKVLVYSMHMTFSCWECNQIKLLTQELLETEFAEELAAGQIEYKAVDYMKNDELAKRYNIASSTVVIVQIRDGREGRFQRLDEVWTKSRNKEDFFAYLGGAIRSYLRGGES